MTDLSTDLTPSADFETSTQLDAGKPTEATPHKEVEEPKEPESRMDAIKRAADDLDKAAPKAEVKEAPKEDGAKPEPKPEEKPEAKEPVEEKKPVEAKERRQPIEPPAKFLPRAKELWHNTPHEVRSEMQRIMNEAETETTQAREATKEYEALRPYVEMAKQSGTTADKAFGQYVQMEQTLRSNPTEGFRALLGNMQMTPQQAIGHICGAFNVTPERLAQHMSQAPNEYTALAPRQQSVQQAPQQNNEVETLKQQLAHMQQSLVQRDVESRVIAPFAEANPRYHELEDMIAQFLKSDIVPKALAPQDRLAAAYDMAVRISPSVRAKSPDPDEGNNSDSRAGEDFGGNKSVRGAPATGVDTSNRRKSKMSRGESIEAAFAELGLTH